MESNSETKIARVVEALNSRDHNLGANLLRELNSNFASQSYSVLDLYDQLEIEAADQPVSALLGIHDQLTYIVWKRNILFLAMQKLLQDGKTEEVRALINRLSPEFVHEGHRVLLKHFAGQGDVEPFIKDLKKCDLRKHRGRIGDAKRLLIRNISQRVSFQAAVELSQRKEFQTKEISGCIGCAVEARVGIDSLPEIIRMAQNLMPDMVEYANRIQIAAMENAYAQGEKIEDHVTSILAWIKNFDPKDKWGQFGLRSLCFWQLASHLLDLGQKELAAKVIHEMPSGKNKSSLRKNFDNWTPRYAKARV